MSYQLSDFKVVIDEIFNEHYLSNELYLYWNALISVDLKFDNKTATTVINEQDWNKIQIFCKFRKNNTLIPKLKIKSHMFLDKYNVHVGYYMKEHNDFDFNILEYLIPMAHEYCMEVKRYQLNLSIKIVTPRFRKHLTETLKLVNLTLENTRETLMLTYVARDRFGCQMCDISWKYKEDICIYSLVEI